METAVNPQKSKWGKDYVSYEKMDMSWIEFTTQNISLSVFLSGWSVQDGMMRKISFSELKHLTSQMAVSSV